MAGRRLGLPVVMSFLWKSSVKHSRDEKRSLDRWVTFLEVRGSCEGSRNVREVKVSTWVKISGWQVFLSEAGVKESW